MTSNGQINRLAGALLRINAPEAETAKHEKRQKPKRTLQRRFKKVVDGKGNRSRVQVR